MTFYIYYKINEQGENKVAVIVGAEYPCIISIIHTQALIIP